MYQFNQTVLVGRLAHDPELKRLSENMTKVTFVLAVGRAYKKKEGKPSVDFIPVSIWGKAAELAFQFLRKGTPTLVSGRIHIHPYEKNNEEKWMTEVVADTFQVLEKKSVREDNLQESVANDH